MKKPIQLVVDPAHVYCARSDPKHEEHVYWKTRTDPADPDMIALISCMREHGTDEGEPILIYTENGSPWVADGDRRVAAARHLNKTCKSDGRAYLYLNALTTRDPVLAARTILARLARWNHVLSGRRER